MKDLPALKLLPCLVFLAILFDGTWATSAALRADLTHIDSGRGFTKGELLRRMSARSTARAASLQYSSSARPSAASAEVPIARPGSEYLIHFGIGTPPQPVALELDTGSDLIWTQCSCAVCYDQTFPVVDTSASATVRGLSCTDPLCRSGGLPLSGCAADDNFCFYVFAYADQSFTTGKILEDTFTLHAPNGTGVTAVPSLRFGCGAYNTDTFSSYGSGIAGFGRGPLSLPSQLQVTRFSYCFTTIGDGRTSPAFLGTPDNIEAQATGPVQSTPFAPGPFYQLSLKGITVGKTRLPFNSSVFALKDDGSGGTFIDSGTAITSFPEAVFQSLRESFVSQMPLPVANNSDSWPWPCFAISSTADPRKVRVPKLILHLDGANWDIPRRNYMLHVEDVDDTGAGNDGLCLVINSSGETWSDSTIIGNFQQQNTHIVYDLEANKMSFVPARCHNL